MSNNVYIQTLKLLRKEVAKLYSIQIVAANLKLQMKRVGDSFSRRNKAEKFYVCKMLQ